MSFCSPACASLSSYYISADGVRSDDFDIQVVEMPNVENIKLTYKYPQWSGLEQKVEDPGGDIRAVDGTKVEIEVKTDKPLENGVLMLDKNPRALHGGGTTSSGSLDGQQRRPVLSGRRSTRARPCASPKISS